MDPTTPNEHTFIQRACSDIRVAISLLTRLPFGTPHNDLAAACWAFPVAGLLVGLGGGCILVTTLALNVPLLAAALLTVGSMVLLTGALHEDGLADMADGVGGMDPEQRLEIMRDSRIGAYGVLALVLTVGLRATAIAAIADTDAAFSAVVAAAALSRGLLPGVMHLLPLASSSGLAVGVGQPTKNHALLAAAIGAALAIVFLGFFLGLGVSILAVIGVVVIALLARHMIGGYNGDSLGAAQQIAEIVILLTAAASL